MKAEELRRRYQQLSTDALLRLRSGRNLTETANMILTEELANRSNYTPEDSLADEEIREEVAQRTAELAKGIVKKQKRHGCLVALFGPFFGYAIDVSIEHLPKRISTRAHGDRDIESE